MLYITVFIDVYFYWSHPGLISPSLAPTAAPALTLAPALAPAMAPALAPLQNDLLESGFEALGSLPSPTPPMPASVPVVPIMVPAATMEPTMAPAPSGGFDASSKWRINEREILFFFICINDYSVTTPLWHNM